MFPSFSFEAARILACAATCSTTSALPTAPRLYTHIMTVKGDDARKDAVTRGSGAEEQEQVPSYQEAVAGTSSATSQQASNAAAPSSTGKVATASADTPAPPAAAQPQQSNMYPFPSQSTQPGYGQSPYQPSGSVPPVIVQGDTLLPLHATEARRGPRAGRRFFIALFWALVLYMILGAVTGTLVQMQERAHQPKTPPGWHHHHEGTTMVR